MGMVATMALTFNGFCCGLVLLTKPISPFPSVVAMVMTLGERMFIIPGAQGHRVCTAEHVIGLD